MSADPVLDQLTRLFSQINISNDPLLKECKEAAALLSSQWDTNKILSNPINRVYNYANLISQLSGKHSSQRRGQGGWG